MIRIVEIVSGRNSVNVHFCLQFDYNQPDGFRGGNNPGVSYEPYKTIGIFLARIRSRKVKVMEKLQAIITDLRREMLSLAEHMELIAGTISGIDRSDFEWKAQFCHSLLVMKIGEIRERAEELHNEFGMSEIET